ncbi:MAG: M23 family metallopeptidase, partial [Gammaproteobacteria bacterium]|nr:M23 family metallopeptidase [Gammaproteobacteria bacterium]
KYIRFIIFFLLINQVSAQVVDYLWPIGDGTAQLMVNGTFNEFRNTTVNWHLHDGIDINGPQYTDVYPVDDGIINQIGSESMFIEHSNGGITQYVHIETTPGYEEGDAVDVSDLIGWTNAEDHLHFAEGPDGTEINPLQLGHIHPFVDYQNNLGEYPQFVNNGFPTNYTGDWVLGITIMENIGNSYNAGSFTGFSTNSSDEFIINGLNRDVDFVVKARDQIFATNGAATPLSSENLGIYYYWAEVYKYNTIIGTVSSDDNINFKSSIFILQ